ncbi:MAG: phosphatase PAP2 family protein [Candidatus Vogelbacteria bacterium]|nr:phosphatase PAP2 family protein [Candidatus Vogelbacteria bacterium]
MIPVNEIIFRWFNGLAGRSPLSDTLIIFLAEYLGWILVIGLVIYFFRRRGQILPVVAIASTSWLISRVIKYFYLHPRPFAPDNSFPSGHGALFSALAFALYLYDRRWGNIYLVGAVLIGLARVAAGVHWPGDVLAGFILGGAVTVLFNLLFGFSRQQHFRD